MSREGLRVFWKYSNYLLVSPDIFSDTLNVWFGCLEASETNKKELWLPCPSGNPSFKNVNFFKFWPGIVHDKSGFSLLENVSRRSPIVLKVFQLSLGKSAHTFRYVEHVIWMPRSFGNKQNKNLLPTKPPCPSGRKRVKNLKKQTLLILWAYRLVKMYSLTSFDKTGCFWKLKA